MSLPLNDIKHFTKTKSTGLCSFNLIFFLIIMDFFRLHQASFFLCTVSIQDVIDHISPQHPILCRSLLCFSFYYKSPLPVLLSVCTILLGMFLDVSRCSRCLVCVKFSRPLFLICPKKFQLSLSYFK